MSVGRYGGKAGQKLIDNTLDFLCAPVALTTGLLFDALKKRHKDLDNKQFSDHVGYLHRSGYILKQGRGANATLNITEKGQNRLKDLKMTTVRLKIGQKWDGRWRMISFDIPVENQPARSALRRLIVELGCRELHQSAWIHPLDISRQVRHIQHVYGATKHITLLEVYGFDREEEFKSKFKHIINSE